jgi:hypothetical protein
MSNGDDRSCGCGPLPHPPPPDIPAGLSALAMRQGSGFPEYREAMLSAIPAKPALVGWRARGAGDLGVMLLEAWAYVLDVTGFYDARVAERAYLATAPDDAAARRLIALIGHRPRPAMAARVKLVVEADGADPVNLPKGTAFRSQPFADQAAQVFELGSERMIWPQRNRWQLAPVRADVFDGTLRFLPRRAPAAGAVVTLWNGTAAAARIASIGPEIGQDGGQYLRAVLQPGSATGFAGMTGEALSGINVAILRLPLALTSFGAAPSSGGVESFVSAPATNTTDVVLDALYPQVRPDEPAVAEIAGILHPVLIKAAVRVSVTIDSASRAQMACTKVTFSPALDLTSGQAFTLHANPFALGAPTRPAKIAIDLDDLQVAGTLVPPVAPIGDAPAGGEAVLLGARKEGVLVPGTVIEDGDGIAHFQPDAGAAPFAAPLAVPLTLYGNVLEAVRGQTVIDETLGSGNPAESFNSFALKKAPLVWVEDASQPAGRRPELTVRVDHLEWRRVDSFFGLGPDERIYIVRQDGDGSTRVVFGDGERGARPPAGADNIHADYRYGAGAAKPPVGLINQIAVPVPGLASVRSPLPATGGADAEAADELRISAPASTLTLGRAVSLADFQALALSFPGILNAAAGWTWDERRQRAAVKLRFISDGGDPSASLVNWLAGQAAPDTVIVAEPAGQAPYSTLAINLEFSPGYDPVLVRAAARAALFDPKTGLLSPRNVAIGRALFRSVVTGRLHEVAGVASVIAILLDGAPMPAAVGPGDGNWFDLEAGATVS